MGRPPSRLLPKPCHSGREPSRGSGGLCPSTSWNCHGPEQTGTGSASPGERGRPEKSGGGVYFQSTSCHCSSKRRSLFRGPPPPRPPPRNHHHVLMTRSLWTPEAGSGGVQLRGGREVRGDLRVCARLRRSAVLRHGRRGRGPAPAAANVASGFSRRPRFSFGPCVTVTALFLFFFVGLIKGSRLLLSLRHLRAHLTHCCRLVCPPYSTLLGRGVLVPTALRGPHGATRFPRPVPAAGISVCL